MRKLTRATVCPCSCSAVCDVPRCQVARALVVDAARRKLTSLMHRSCGKQAVSRDAVLKAFKSLGSLTAELEDDNILAKCQQMCQDHDLSPTDLAYKWEAHTDKVAVCLRARGVFMEHAYGPEDLVDNLSLCCHLLSRSVCM